MKTTAQLFTSIVVLAWLAGPHTIHAGFPSGGSFTNKSNSLSDAELRQRADRLLDQARKAMREGNYDYAEFCIGRAEELGVTYEPFVAKFKYTPAKAWQELEQYQSIRGQSPVTSLPPTGGLPSDNATSPHAGDDKEQRRAALLLDARLQLAKRDTARAAQLVNQAKSIKGAFSPLGDSPERIEELMQRSQMLNTNKERNMQNPEFVRHYARFLMDQAVGLMNYKQFDRAETLAMEAKQLQAQFRPFEQTPDKLLAQIAQQKPGAESRIADVRSAGFNDGGQRYSVQRGDYIPSLDHSRNIAASREQEGAQRFPPTDSADQGEGPDQGEAPDQSEGHQWYRQGLSALENRDMQSALEAFRKAWQYREQLDPRTLRDVQDKMTWLRARDAEPVPGVEPQSPLDNLDQQQQLVLQRLQQDVLRERDQAERMKPTDPRAGLRLLENLHDRVANAEIPADQKRQWLIIVDRSIADMKQYIEHNLAQIENDELNRSRMADVTERREHRIGVQNELAQLVDKFNELLDQNRFAEARVIARQAHELAPHEPVVENMMWKAKFVHRIASGADIRNRAEEGFYTALESVDETGIPFDDRHPFQYGDVTRWRDLSAERVRRARDQGRQLSPEEIRIQQALREKKVQVSFTNRPLREVIDFLGAQAGVNIHLDQKGLIGEGVSSDQPVTITLNEPISLKSALNIILQGLNLGYVVQNEVINVTSVSLRNQNTHQKVYYVADLVIPIPNFVPSYNIGLPGALAHAHQTMGYGMPASGSVPFTVAANPAANMTHPIADNPFAPQMLGNVGPTGSMGGSRAARPVGYDATGMGGGPAADFDSLIELITSTIEPESWDEVGGPGSVEGFDANLSLVVSQTQEVHDQIAALLDQLRRLQDLQVTIEVRFITVSDNFAEFIGIDFDFEIDDNTGLQGNTDPRLSIDDTGPSRIIGLGRDGNPTADLDLSFAQQGFAAAAPAFGGFDAATAANFGFAILSDIEVFFLLQAGQSNERSNILEAPKATLFNGQQATVSNTTQVPFVTSVIPVVGDFAAAHQPVVVVLSEGTSLSIQAVVSADRRYVRLTLVPFFSKIGDVSTFTFDGKKTVLSGSGLTDPTTGEALDDDAVATITEGTTVQLPQFTFTTVTTTVSVPDGGTVLLGGIKSLREERNEEGVPFFSKIPYINRLFRNTGIGRETTSLMMMVTPRIIIQEEEEIEQTGLDSSRL